MTDEQRQTVCRLLEKRHDPSLLALIYDRNAKTALVPQSTEQTYIVKRLTETDGLPGRVRIPPKAIVYAAFPINGDGRVQSVMGWAAACVPEEGFVKIVTETQPAFRQKGVGLACLTALVRGESGPFLYLCRKKNIASYRLAVKAGFRPYSQPDDACPPSFP